MSPYAKVCIDFLSQRAIFKRRQSLTASGQTFIDVERSRVRHSWRAFPSCVGCYASRGKGGL
jgi:hypothetical protein